MARTLATLGIRFRGKDLNIVRRAATREGEQTASWMRETLLQRAVAEEEGIAVPPLPTETESGGVLITVRMSPEEMRRLFRAATKAGLKISPWARAVSLEAALRPSKSRPRPAAEEETKAAS